MTKETVTNNSANQIVMGGVLIPSGETREVTDWDSVKDTFPVKRFVEQGAIVLGGKAPKKTADQEARDIATAQLDATGAKYDPDASTKDLQRLAGTNVDDDKQAAKEVADAAKAAEKLNAENTGAPVTAAEEKAAIAAAAPAAAKTAAKK